MAFFCRCVYTTRLSQALSRFVSGITAAKVDVKYAVVMIAGNPAIAQPFTVRRYLSHERFSVTVRVTENIFFQVRRRYDAKYVKQYWVWRNWVGTQS